MDFAHLFEAIMLVCFGFSWPLNVRKAYKARTAKGTSLAFIILIITGYIAGITAKFIHHQYNYVLVVYFLNLVIVFTNVLVYIRNKALDRKAGATKTLKMTAKDIKSRLNQNENSLRISSEENIETCDETQAEEKNAVILLGTGTDKMIPVSNLANEFSFNFPIYNKSRDTLSLSAAQDYIQSEISPLMPEAFILHLGENDKELFAKSQENFDNLYLSLIESIKNGAKNTRVAIVSVKNPTNDPTITSMNAHIKAISEAEACTFINLENAKLWNPNATKAANDFAYSMGLNIRKPLKNVAEILYSYAHKELELPDTQVQFAG